jgi:SH3 domain protein
MNRVLFILGFFLGFYLMGHWCWASGAYVTDSFDIRLYDGPSAKSKVIAVLSTGEAVKVFLTQDDWSFVRLLERGENNIEGFVPSRHLSTRIPWEVQARQLKEENMGLKGQRAQFERSLSEAVHREQDLSAKAGEQAKELDRVQRAYTLLRQEAADYLTLKEAHTSILSLKETAKEDIDRLTDENQRLMSSQRNRFFIVGGLVLLTGLVIGLAIGKELKKRRSFYY